MFAPADIPKLLAVRDATPSPARTLLAEILVAAGVEGVLYADKSPFAHHSMSTAYVWRGEKELSLRELEHALLRSGDLVEVSGDLLYLPATLEAIVEQTRAIPDGFTVADFRDALGITRKYAVPLVEWLDRTGVTVREGDVRRTVG